MHRLLFLPLFVESKKPASRVVVAVSVLSVCLAKRSQCSFTKQRCLSRVRDGPFFNDKRELYELGLNSVSWELASLPVIRLQAPVSLPSAELSLEPSSDRIPLHRVKSVETGNLGQDSSKKCFRPVVPGFNKATFLEASPDFLSTEPSLWQSRAIHCRRPLCFC